MWHTVNVRRCDSLRCCYIFIVATHLIRPEQNKKICNYFLRLAKGVFFQNHFPFRSFFCGVYVSRCSIHHLIRVWVASLIHLIKSRVRERKKRIILVGDEAVPIGNRKKSPPKVKWKANKMFNRKNCIEFFLPLLLLHLFFDLHWKMCTQKPHTKRELEEKARVNMHGALLVSEFGRWMWIFPIWLRLASP